MLGKWNVTSEQSIPINVINLRDDEQRGPIHF